MSESIVVELGELAPKIPSVNPAKFPDEIFDLLSIPAYDAGAPQVVSGSEIGSNKQLVEPGDVMISKIVPHIRRVWVVPEPSERGRRQLASSEWIVFRTDRVLNRWLRFYLLSDSFHAQFMNTVAGVGGSLLRARPQFVKKITLTIPPLLVQEKEAEIEELKAIIQQKRERQQELLSELKSALFSSMFEGKNYPIMTLEEISIGKGTYGANVPSVEPIETKPRYIRITDINDDGRLNEEVRSPAGAELDWINYKLEPGDLLFARSGATVGKTYLHRDPNLKAIYAGYLIKFKLDTDIVDPNYIFSFTQTQSYKAWVKSKQNVVAQPNINAKQYGSELKIPIPPLEIQQKFSRLTQEIDSFPIRK